MRDYGVTNLAPYASAPPVGLAGDTYYNSVDGREYISNGSAWLPLVGIPAGGGQDQVLQKNSSADYDDGWTSIIGANGGISQIVAQGNNTFGQIDGRRINGTGALAGLQNAFNFRGLGYDGVSAYRVLGSIGLGSDLNAVSPTNAGGTVTFNTTANGTLTNTARARIDGNGMVEIVNKLKIGQATATAGLTGSVLDLSNGLLNMRRQAYAVTSGFLNDLTLPTSSFIEFTGATGSCSVSGFAGGVDGAVINFLYTGTQPFSFLHQQTSVAANQIYIPTAATLYTNGPFAGTLIYSTALSKWVMTYFSADQFQAPGTVVQERQMAIMGGWGAGSIPTYTVVGNQPAGWGTMTKRYAGTNIVVDMGCSCWVTTAANVVSVGVSPTGQTTNITKVAQFFFNTTGVHAAFTGMAAIFSLAAGAYTFTAYVQLPTGSGFNSDTNDSFWMRVREMW